MVKRKDEIIKELALKENDLEGRETLEAIAQAHRLNHWFYQTISPRLSGRILEIGSGIGNISGAFLKDKRKIHLSDLRACYCQHLRAEFNRNPFVEGITQINLVHPDFEKEYAHLINGFDGVFALNVIEHIKDDVKAIANCKKLLRTGGRLLILVPAYPFLYNSFDRALEHYRRYTSNSLSRLFELNDLKIDHQQFFNFAGIFGWYFSGTLLQKKIIPSSQMRIYDKLVPFFKYLDKAVGNHAGLSLIVEGIKK